jgi:spermidine synthase
MGRAALKTAEIKPFVKVERGRKVLRVGGVIQSVAVDAAYLPDVWDAMLPDTRPAAALILGLGGGTIASLMTQRWGALPIIGVERDPAVAYLARGEFGLGELPHVRIVEADAFTYVRQSKERFDFICVDLYVAGKMAYGVLGGSFLRDVARILTPNGTATFNLWRSPYLPDQLRRLARALDVRTTIRVDENIVVSCGRRDSHNVT